MRPALQRPCRRRDHGFAMIEVMLGLLLIALLASVLLPGVLRAGAPAALRSAAYRVSALLRDERTRASTLGRPTRATVDASHVRSDSTGEQVDLPSGAAATLSSGTTGINFFANGRSSGGTLLMQGSASSLAIVINADTGAISLESR